MELEDKKLIEILNILLKDNGKNINSLEKLINFKFLSELIKII